jgi:alkylation response protein AidB-like acyl-CoA dehydrogenase
MNFALDDEQIALKVAVKSFFDTKVSSDLIRRSMESGVGLDHTLYTAMCDELGLTALIIDEEYGGFAASDIELNIAIEQHGYYLVPSPLRVHSYATILLQECASEEAKEQFLPILAEGKEIATVAFGDFEQVLFANIAKHMFFVEDGKLFHLDLKQEGVEHIPQKCFDPTQPISKVIFNKEKAKLISQREISDSYKTALARMTILLSNEMLGASNRVFDMALAYSKEREQFGKAIGSFQVIKHMLSDMYVEIEKAKSLCQYGAYISSIKEDKLSEAAAMSKYFMSSLFSHIAKESIQIHGGIGFTYEHDAHLFLKRSQFAKYELGSENEHCEALAQIIFS